MIYDKTLNMSFQQKMKTIQYNAALATTSAIRGSYKEKLYGELVLETLQQLRLHRKFCSSFLLMYPFIEEPLKCHF